MRLNCKVAVQNWSCTQGLVSRCKPTQSSLSIGRKPGRVSDKNGENDGSCEGTVFLMLSTASNMSGTKYKICGNIANIFGKFVREGKATIRFKQPTHELCLIKADPSSLHKFLTTLKMSSKDHKNVKLPVLVAAKRSEVQKVKTDLMIISTDEYHLKAGVIYPETLQKLSVVNCSLIRFDVRILALRQLVVLNLSNNKLKELDFSLEHLKFLRVLNLSSNLLTRLPSKICHTSKLTALDLSHNYMTCLPAAFGAMISLVNVKLNNNHLQSLPSNLQNLANLRCLNVSNNQLVVLPSTLFSAALKLDAVDISGNMFLVSEPEAFQDYNFLSDTLQEHAAKVIRKSRISYNQNVVGKYLCDYLDSASMCFTCQQPCFNCYYQVTRELKPKTIAREVTSLRGAKVNVEVYSCSLKCS